MKKRIILLINLMFLVLPVSVNALNGSVSLNCSNTKLALNETTNCTLTGNSNEGISGISAKLSVSGNIAISNIKTSSIWQGNGNDGMIDLYTDDNKSGNFQIATFTIKASSIGSGTINVSGIKFSDYNFITHDISNIALNITIENPQTPSNPEPPKENNNTTSNNNTTQKKSNDATLKKLIINTVPILLKNKQYQYSIDVKNEVTEITLNVQANNSKAKVTLPENLTLTEGVNKFSINVLAEDGTQQTYTVTVNRLERELSNNSQLSELKINGYELNFNSDIYTYDLGDIDKSELELNAKVADEKAKVEIYGNKEIGSKDAIVLKVTAENGSESEYIIYANNLNKLDSQINEVNQSNSNYLNIILTIIILLLISLLIYTNRNKIFQKKKIEY